MSFANYTILRTPQHGFLAPAGGNYAARAATSFGLAYFYVADDAALKGSTEPTTIDRTQIPCFGGLLVNAHDGRECPSGSVGSRGHRVDEESHNEEAKRP